MGDQMIKLNSAALRAAFNFKAKDDIRKHLNGINIDQDCIVGSNGHVAVIIPSEIPEGVMGVLYMDKIPVATAVETVFDNGSAISYDSNGKEKGRCAYTFEQQINIAPYKDVLPETQIVEEGGFCLAPDYLALIGKSFPRPKKASKYAIKLINSKPNTQEPVMFEVKAEYLPKGTATVCIAPVKE